MDKDGLVLGERGGMRIDFWAERCGEGKLSVARRIIKLKKTFHFLQELTDYLNIE